MTVTTTTNDGTNMTMTMAMTTTTNGTNMTMTTATTTTTDRTNTTMTTTTMATMTVTTTTTMMATMTVTTMTMTMTMILPSPFPCTLHGPRSPPPTPSLPISHSTSHYLLYYLLLPHSPLLHSLEPLHFLMSTYIL
jgi:hypothetical protein